MGICSERGKERDSFRNEMFNSKRYPNLIQRLVILFSIVCALTLSASAQSNTVPSTDGSFWVNLPQSFGPAGSPPAGTILAVEIPNSGVSLFAQKGEAVELDPKLYADRQKQMIASKLAPQTGLRENARARACTDNGARACNAVPTH